MVYVYEYLNWGILICYSSTLPLFFKLIYLAVFVIDYYTDQMITKLFKKFYYKQKSDFLPEILTLHLTL